MRVVPWPRHRSLRCAVLTSEKELDEPPTLSPPYAIVELVEMVGRAVPFHAPR
jgi:hypothetical protein